VRLPRIFDGVYSGIDTDFQGKVLNVVKKIERGDGAVSRFRGFSQALVALGLTIKGFFFWVAQSSGRQADFSDRCRSAMGISILSPHPAMTYKQWAACKLLIMRRKYFIPTHCPSVPKTSAVVYGQAGTKRISSCLR
jgi:hypothetical protein